jgi:hypothetical protein
MIPKSIVQKNTVYVINHKYEKDNWINQYHT